MNKKELKTTELNCQVRIDQGHTPQISTLPSLITTLNNHMFSSIFAHILKLIFRVKIFYCFFYYEH